MLNTKAKTLYLAASRQPGALVPYLAHRLKSEAQDRINRKRASYVSHLGGLRGNAGDVLISYAQRRLFDSEFGPQIWVAEPMKRPVEQHDLDQMVQHAKVVVVGGGGHLIPAHPKWPVNHSDWNWNIPIAYLDQIPAPIIVFAIGYNKMRREREFLPIFGEHVTKLLETSKFFGMRNYASIESLKRWVPASLHEKIAFQPCPTNVMSMIDPVNWSADRDVSRRSVAIVPFSGVTGVDVDAIGEDISKLINIARQMKNKGWEVDIATHTKNDLMDVYKVVEAVPGVTHTMVDLMSPDAMIKYYKRKTLIVGMRGHGVMVPYGLGVPVIALINYDKVKFFMQSVKLGDFCVELADPHSDAKILDLVDHVVANYAATCEKLDEVKQELWCVTKRNMDVIRPYFV